mmetsp:Transcript_40976/g.101866  ORF Transcript_40976/g.101866 Transcript_40976/m.101866 type:complete len:237 (-) Transcript_40976:21-731(-)
MRQPLWWRRSGLRSSGWRGGPSRRRGRSFVGSCFTRCDTATSSSSAWPTPPPTSAARTAPTTPSLSRSSTRQPGRRARTPPRMLSSPKSSAPPTRRAAGCSTCPSHSRSWSPQPSNATTTRRCSRTRSLWSRFSRLRSLSLPRRRVRPHLRGRVQRTVGRFQGSFPTGEVLGTPPPVGLGVTHPEQANSKATRCLYSCPIDMQLSFTAQLPRRMQRERRVDSRNLVSNATSTQRAH